MLERAKLYGILDLGYVEVKNALATGEQLLAAGVEVLQLRAKKLSEKEIVAVGRKLGSLCRASHVPFILNDFPHLVAEVGADGVHIGQDDGLIQAARHAIGHKGIVGRSTHSVQQARTAWLEGADYIGFGPLFATPTKPEYVPIGLKDITTVQKESPVPVFCIGGIKRENLSSIVAAGARRVVMVTGLLHAENLFTYVRECRQILG